MVSTLLPHLLTAVIYSNHLKHTTILHFTLYSLLLYHTGTPIRIYQVAQCIGIAHEKAMTQSNIKAGFRKCGILPFEHDVFVEEEFLISYVTDINDNREWIIHFFFIFS